MHLCAREWLGQNANLLTITICFDKTQKIRKLPNTKFNAIMFKEIFFSELLQQLI